MFWDMILMNLGSWESKFTCFPKYAHNAEAKTNHTRIKCHASFCSTALQLFCISFPCYVCSLFYSPMCFSVSWSPTHIQLPLPSISFCLYIFFNCDIVYIYTCICKTKKHQNTKKQMPYYFFSLVLGSVNSRLP